MIYLFLIPSILLGSMILTLLLSLIVNENGEITVKKNSIFYMTRFFCFLGVATATACFKDWGNRRKYSIFKDQKMVELKYHKRILNDAHFLTENETNLCRLFWQHILCFFFLIPLNIIIGCIAIGLAISIIPIAIGIISIYGACVLIKWTIYNPIRNFLLWLEEKETAKKIEIFEKRTETKLSDEQKFIYEIEGFIKNRCNEAKWLTGWTTGYGEDEHLTTLWIDCKNTFNEFCIDLENNLFASLSSLMKRIYDDSYIENNEIKDNLFILIIKKTLERFWDEPQFNAETIIYEYETKKGKQEIKKMEDILTKYKILEHISSFIDYESRCFMEKQNEIVTKKAKNQRMKHEKKLVKQATKAEKRDARKRKWEMINKFRKRWLCPRIVFK